MASPVQSITPRSTVAITKSDSTIFNVSNGGPLAGLYVGGAGDVAVTTQNGEVVTFSAVPVGTIIPITCTKVMSTNTTASLIQGLRY
jgi:hypothetical protein